MIFISIEIQSNTHGHNYFPSPENSIDFNIFAYKKNILPLLVNIIIFMVLMAFESYMNKAINKGYLVKFQHSIFHL